MEAAAKIACGGSLFIRHRGTAIYGQINETHMITSGVCHAVTTIGTASADPQLHSFESVSTMDHLSRAQAIIERIVTGEVSNLVQRGPVWIKSAIIPSNYYRASVQAYGCPGGCSESVE
jgi:hypothetical protein